MRKWIIPLAVLMVVPALGAAAPIIQPAEPETLVEGHTVFTVIEQVNAIAIAQEEYGAAVAVLVREVEAEAVNFRFPGVLWFNDQYLVNPVQNNQNNVNFRFPCTGAVMAVNKGAGDPMVEFAKTVDAPVYNETYIITDPNDHQWTIDKWNSTIGPIWVVAILNNQAGINTPDDGVTSCAPVDEGEDLTLPACPTGAGSLALQPLRCRDETYTTSNGNAVSYNALLYFVLGDLTVANTTKDHNDGSADRTNDVSGCHETDAAYAGGNGPSPKQPTDDGSLPDANVHPTLTGRDDSTAGQNRGQWPCPGGDDFAEGNSHSYNPFGAGIVCPNCAGAGNHGGSGGGPNLHATRDVDIYYGSAPAPAARAPAKINDLEGSTAPFHCHQASGCIDAPGAYPGTDNGGAYGGRGY